MLVVREGLVCVSSMICLTFPKSSRTYQIMAQAHQKKNDKDAAIKDLEKAVELDPNNNQAKTQLQQLKGQ